MRFFFFFLVKIFPTIPGVTLAIFAIHFPSIDIYLYIKQYVCYSANCFDFAIHRTRFVIFDGVLFDEIEK